MKKMKPPVLKESFFRTVKNEVEAKVSDLNLKDLEPHVRLEDWNRFKDTIRVYITPRGDVDCKVSCYSPAEERELRKKLGDISLIISDTSRKYELDADEFEYHSHSYKLVKRK